MRAYSFYINIVRVVGWDDEWSGGLMNSRSVYLYMADISDIWAWIQALSHTLPPPLGLLFPPILISEIIPDLSEITPFLTLPGCFSTFTPSQHKNKGENKGVLVNYYID